MSEVDKILGMVPINTTEMHRFHLFDQNCDICRQNERENQEKKVRELEERKKDYEAKLIKVNTFLVLMYNIAVWLFARNLEQNLYETCVLESAKNFRCSAAEKHSFYTANSE